MPGPVLVPVIPKVYVPMPTWWRVVQVQERGRQGLGAVGVLLWLLWNVKVQGIILEDLPGRGRKQTTGTHGRDDSCGPRQR